MSRIGFLAEILEHPDDDTPRLIFADWLDDHGEPDRAELIRLQVESAALPEGDPRAVSREEQRRGPADTRAGPRHHSNLACQAHGLLSWRRARHPGLSPPS